MELRVEDFGKDFAWGVSAAAYQIEGAHQKHGKGPSIWDEFTRRKGKIYKDQNANITCDFYQNYHQDLALMRALNIPNFRFSLSWSRIFPEGTGHVNRAGVDFYKRVIDFCLELEIEPWITLYHWDLPQALEQRGGWTNRDVVGWFTDYVAFCARTFGDKAKNWMILNEPMAFTGAGYFLGIHAPGRRGLTNFLQAMHHAALCQAEGARALKAVRSDLQAGTTFSFSHVEPASQSPEDCAAAHRIDALLNRTYIEPLLGLGYPWNDIKILQRVEQYMRDGDDLRLQFDMDFIGVQTYTREVVSYSYFTPFVQARIVKATERAVEHTLMNWEVYPESTYQVLKKVAGYRQVKKIIVTENGAAFNDEPEDGQVNDTERRQYLHDHIKEVLRAKKEGIPVEGYFVWTFTDNFEWAEGYRPRFGLVYIDFASQKRIVKSSGLWYAKFLGSLQADLPEGARLVPLYYSRAKG
jgi:beta-glucosidase